MYRCALSACLAAAAIAAGAGAPTPALASTEVPPRLTVSGDLTQPTITQDLHAINVSTQDLNGGGLAHLYLYYDGQLVDDFDMHGTSYSADVGPYDATPGGGLAPGAHSVTVGVENGIGLAASKTLSFTIDSTPPPEEPEPGALQQQAAAAYVAAFGGTQDEAMRRVKFQDDVGEVADDVGDALGPNFAGSWFDASDGGRFEVGTTVTSGAGVDRARQILAARGVLDQTDFVQTQHSQGQLDAALAGLEQRVDSLVRGGKVRPGEDPSINALAIDVSNDMTVAETQQLNDAIAQSPVPVTVSPTGHPSALGHRNSCDRSNVVPLAVTCDRPLRGGVTLDSSLTSDDVDCTAGFMARGRDAGNLYVLTAGHCLISDLEVWSAHHTESGPFSIGHRAAWTDGPEDDAGIIRIEPDSFWAHGRHPAPWIVQSESPPFFSKDNDAYTIRGRRASRPGAIICQSSAILSANGHYTECGPIRRVDVEIAFPDGVVNHLGEAVIQGAVDGSSGGPFFKDHRAMGLMVGSEGVEPIVWYEGISRAEDAMNVDILTTLHP